MSEDKLKAYKKKEQRAASQILFNMIGFINFTLSKKYTVLQRKALSIRDVINAIEFIKVVKPLFPEGEKSLPEIVYHAISLVIIDGLCLGIDVAGERQKDCIANSSLDYMNSLITNLCWKKWN